MSQFYLRGFIDREADESWLHVLDRDKRDTFKTKPRNLAAVRDFNRVNAEGVDPNAFETEMSRLESAAAGAWVRVHEGLPFEGEDRELILTMAALQHIRTPERREQWRQTRAHSAEVVMDAVLASEDRWNAHVRRAREAGADLPEVSYAEATRFYEEKAYRIDVSQEGHLHMEFVGLDVVMPLFLARNWVLFRTDPRIEPFITSDQPVHLAWINPENVPPIHRNHPGHGFKDTRVWFPLSSELALVGEFDGPTGEHRAHPDGVAIINHMTMRGSRRRLYAPTLDFHYLTSDGSIHDGHHLLEKLRESPAQEILI
ncbi:MAG: DUF4238 domain-containing protein [Rhodanobacter sp.]